MIRLNYIKGVNIGRHRLVEKTVTGNVLGLWGVSGAGKSTILQLLEWLINGKIEHPDPIAEFVRANEVEDIKKMEGFAKFTVDGKPMEISRSHSRAGTSTRELRWDKQGDKWGTVEKSAAGAEALMTSLIGANQKAISSIVFVRQGAFGKLFSGLDTDRRDFFVRLLMLGHLEKIASITDTYRKELMGSVKDMSALRDQSETAYQQALQYFEEVDFALSNMRSYKADIDAGSDLVRSSDQLTNREFDVSSQGSAFDAGLASLGMTRASSEGWLRAADAELVTLREILQATTDRRKSRTAYESSVAKLTNEISCIRLWMEKNDQHTALTEKLQGMEVDAAKPDPRIRINQLDLWEAAYRESAALDVVEAGLPSEVAAAHEVVAIARKLSLATDEACNTALGEWVKATADLKDLTDLCEAVSHSSDGQQCKACGNEHPDPKFLAVAISNTKVLVDKLRGESNPLEDLRRAHAAALNEAVWRETALGTRVNTSMLDRKRLDAALNGAPTGDAIITERDHLYAGLPAWDAAKSMRDHLRTERRALTDAMGQASYTRNELDGRTSELSLAEQMLGILPAMAEIEATIKDLTDRGVALREQRDRVHQLKTSFENAQFFYDNQLALYKELLERLAKERPFLISSIQALGPVITSENRDKVLMDFREKQTKFDEQTGLVVAARRALAEADAALQEIDVRIEEQKSRIQIGKELESVRSAFLPSGITTDYLTHQFERIAVAAQDHLAQMSADFMVVSSEKRALSFDFVRLNEPNGSWLNQNRMSGGQQVKLAIAVLLAIHELVIPQVGLLVLDEPSTHLDTESKIALAEVLREIGQRGNFQLIVCDHSPELKDAYTDIIELYPDPV